VGVAHTDIGGWHGFTFDILVCPWRMRGATVRDPKGQLSCNAEFCRAAD
jgi:hypothetical protein